MAFEAWLVLYLQGMLLANFNRKEHLRHRAVSLRRHGFLVKSKFLEICDGLQGFCQIHTDGSKTNNGTAAAAVSGDVVKSLRITSHASIFTAELIALNLALDIIRRSRRKKFVIFSDSLSGLVAIRNSQLETAYVQKFIINYCQLVNAGNYYPDLDTRSYWYPR